MNTKNWAVVFVLLTATGAAWAQSTDYVRPDENFVSTKTRAEVITELKQAQADGSYVAGGEAYANKKPVPVKRDRARAEAIDTARSTKDMPGSGS